MSYVLVGLSSKPPPSGNRSNSLEEGDLASIMHAFENFVHGDLGSGSLGWMTRELSIVEAT